VSQPTLPAAAYRADPARLARERQAIFAREWLFFGFGSDLSQTGDYVAADLAGWPLLVAVDDDGGLRAHHNVCRHRAGPLVDDGRGHARSLVCRYHGWSYGLDGRLRSARDFGCELDADVALWPVHVDVWRGLVFVHLGEPVRALVDALAGFADACAPYDIESFRVTGHAEHRLACNWKTYADNYLEGYHIPLVHPALNKAIDTKRYEVVVREDGRWVEHRAPARSGAATAGRWLWRWPNLALNLYPEGMNVERYDPVGSTTTRLRYSYAFAATVDDADVDEVLRTSAEITAEDALICEQVQQRLDSGVYVSGVLSPKHEQAVAAFQRWVAEACAESAVTAELPGTRRPPFSS
jgi:choline monooxygenase